MGEAARADSRRRDCAAENRMVGTVARCREVPESGRSGKDAFSWFFRGRGETVDRTESERPGIGQHERRSEEHTSELQSLRHLVCRLLLEKKKTSSNKI